jgi:predicted site-specific integrase-resolvase
MSEGQLFEFGEKAAARILNVAPRTLRAWRREQKIDHYKLPNGRIRYSMDQLLEFQRSTRVPAVRAAA